MPAYRVIPSGDLALAGDGLSPLGSGYAAGGSYTTVEGIQQIRQRLSARMRFFLAEWFLDLRKGIPYFRDVFVKRPNLAIIRSLMLRVILTTPGVLSCPRFDIVMQGGDTRRARFRFQAVCNGGVIDVKPEDEDFIPAFASRAA